MYRRSLLLSLVVLLVTGATVGAQTSGSQSSSKEDERRREELEREKRALEMVAETIKDVRSLRSPQNRIVLLAMAGETLWKHDEKKARALFNEAAREISEVLDKLHTDDESESVTHKVFAMRQQVLQTLSRLDPRLALDFLNATRQPGLALPGHVGGQSIETSLRFRVASETVEKDPELSLKIAEESLKDGLSHDLTGLAQQLYYKDKQLGERLVSVIMDRLRSTDLVSDTIGAYVATNLLSTSTSNRRLAERQPSEQSGSNAENFRLSDRATSELMTMVAKAALTLVSAADFLPHAHMGPAQVYLSALQGMAPELEKHAPHESSALAPKLEEYKKFVEAQSGLWGRFNNPGPGTSLDDLLKNIDDAPAEMRPGLYQSAAFRALNDGDSERARKIASEKIADPRYRKDVLLNIDRQALWRLVNDGKLDQARQMVQNFPRKDEQASILASLAMNAASNGDKKTALQLINEAQLAIGPAPKNYSEMESLLRIAFAYSQFDTAKGFEVIEQSIDRLNQLVSAASVLDGFDIQSYFENEELALTNMNSLANMLNQYVEHLGMLAPKDFSRARTAADRFERFEVQAKARLHIARSLLSQNSSGDGSAVGNLPVPAMRFNRALHYITR